MSFCSLVVDRQTPNLGKYIDEGKGKKILNIPHSKLTEEERSMWVQFVMALYDPDIEKTKIIDLGSKSKRMTVIGVLYYSLKFALAGKGGRFKEYVQ